MIAIKITVLNTGLVQTVVGLESEQFVPQNFVRIVQSRKIEFNITRFAHHYGRSKLFAIWTR